MSDKIARKMQASKEVCGKIFGTIDTREEFVPILRELAEHEWHRLKANNSLECRNYHSAESIDITRQGARASAAHELYLFTGQHTCIDCHKGIWLPRTWTRQAPAVPRRSRTRGDTILENPSCRRQRSPFKNNPQPVNASVEWDDQKSSG